MRFEYDPEKSQKNRVKHGMDFDKAQKFLDDPDLLEIPARVEGESRFLIIGKISGKYWSAVITYRNGTIRIISVRRSRKMEIELYENP